MYLECGNLTKTHEKILALLQKVPKTYQWTEVVRVVGFCFLFGLILTMAPTAVQCSYHDAGALVQYHQRKECPLLTYQHKFLQLF